MAEVAEGAVNGNPIFQRSQILNNRTARATRHASIAAFAKRHVGGGLLLGLVKRDRGVGASGMQDLQRCILLR